MNKSNTTDNVQKENLITFSWYTLGYHFNVWRHSLMLLFSTINRWPLVECSQKYERTKLTKKEFWKNTADKVNLFDRVPTFEKKCNELV